MNINRNTFLGLCRQAMFMCSGSASRAWVDPELIKECTNPQSTANLLAVSFEDEEHSTTVWSIEGHRPDGSLVSLAIPLLVRTNRLHELERKAS